MFDGIIIRGGNVCSFSPGCTPHIVVGEEDKVEERERARITRVISAGVLIYESRSSGVVISL